MKFQMRTVKGKLKCADIITTFSKFQEKRK